MATKQKHVKILRNLLIVMKGCSDYLTDPEVNYAKELIIDALSNGEDLTEIEDMLRYYFSSMQPQTDCTKHVQRIASDLYSFISTSKADQVVEETFLEETSGVSGFDGKLALQRPSMKMEDQKLGFGFDPFTAVMNATAAFFNFLSTTQGQRVCKKILDLDSGFEKKVYGLFNRMHDKVT